MEKSRSSLTPRATALTVIALLLLSNCAEPVPEEITPGYSTVPSDSRLSLSDPDNLFSSIIVQQGFSIEDAIDAAKPGQVVYIEPGKYNEAISLKNKDIKLIGMSGALGEKVIVESLSDRDKDRILNVFSDNHQSPDQDFKSFFQPDDDELNSIFSARKSYSAAKSDFISKSFYRLFSNAKRKHLTRDIVHYEFEIPLGRGPFDIVRLHRVVREDRPYYPTRTKGDIFMVHGASQDFDDIFLSAGSDRPTKNTSSPIYLAGKDIDVWGIDLAWTMVPLETTDFSFMKNWGVRRDVNHTLAAISIARIIRGLTGQNFGPMNLLGFSYGVAIAYTAAGQETQKPHFLRNVKGIIPVDGGMKYADADDASRMVACEDADNFKSAIEGGMYQTTLGVDIAPIGMLASSDPLKSSPFFAGLTNFQAALAVGTSPARLPLAPSWHFVGGNINSLAYTDEARWIKLLTVLAPYQPQRTGYEYRACLCDEEESYLDDHLTQIKVPILYLGAGGGFGSLGDYTTILTASSDITTFTVNKQLSEHRHLDYGHADLWMGHQAANDVWEVLRIWLISHHSNNP